MSQNLKKYGKLEQERFADSVAELNERIARERDEESEFLLQNQDYEDFQGMSKIFFLIFKQIDALNAFYWLYKTTPFKNIPALSSSFFFSFSRSAG